MNYTNSQIRELIAEWVHSERDRKVMERRLVDGLTFERLAEEFDMSLTQVKRIVYRLQEELFRHI